MNFLPNWSKKCVFQFLERFWFKISDFWLKSQIFHKVLELKFMHFWAKIQIRWFVIIRPNSIFGQNHTYDTLCQSITMTTFQTISKSLMSHIEWLKTLQFCWYFFVLSSTTKTNITLFIFWLSTQCKLYKRSLWTDILTIVAKNIFFASFCWTLFDSSF